MSALNYIQIRGYQTSADEVFQGIAGNSVATTENGGNTPGGGVTELTIDWQPLLDALSLSDDQVNSLSQYLTEVDTWIDSFGQSANTFFDDVDGNELPVPVYPLPPIVSPGDGIIASIIYAVLLSLGVPVHIIVKVIQVMKFLKTIKNIVDFLKEWLGGDDNAEIVNVLKKAFLFSNEDLSILKTALLEDVQGTIESILDNRLKDLQFNDAEYDMPNSDIRLSTHGRYIQYGAKQP